MYEIGANERKQELKSTREDAFVYETETKKEGRKIRCGKKKEVAKKAT